MKAILLVGNPRRGKSSILNALLKRKGYRGDVTFKAGMTFAGALTQEFQCVQHDGVSYGDTPGLTDPIRQQKAASEIKRGLEQEGAFIKLVFVVTIQQGMVLYEDLTTMKTVLDAIHGDSSIEFGVLVNQVEEEVWDALFGDFGDVQNLKDSKGLIQQACGHKLDPSMIHYEPKAAFKRGKPWAPTKELFQFIESVPFNSRFTKVDEIKAVDQRALLEMQELVTSMTKALEEERKARQKEAKEMLKQHEEERKARLKEAKEMQKQHEALQRKFAELSSQLDAAKASEPEAPLFDDGSVTGKYKEMFMTTRMTFYSFSLKSNILQAEGTEDNGPFTLDGFYFHDKVTFYKRNYFNKTIHQGTLEVTSTGFIITGRWHEGIFKNGSFKIKGTHE
ncbi:hypothetical protein BDR26DRAFT_1011650 [Obelidium mucronatum]|nr:hypothetical protein BDR26DRAFT_1011650 [Obelidium mucronatum]